MSPVLVTKPSSYRLWRPLAVVSAILALSGLTACSPGSQVQEPTRSDTITEALDRESLPSEAAPAPEVYKMPNTRVPYQKVIDDWVSQDEKVFEEIGESTSQEDLEKRAEVTAALYLKYAEEDSRDIFYDSSVNLIAAPAEWNNNPIFGTDPRTANNNQLDAMLGAQELFPTMEFLERARSGDPEGSRLIQGKVYNTLSGVNHDGWGATLGFAGADARAILLHAEDSPERPETVTERLSDAEAEAILQDKKLYAPPSTTFWVKTTPKGENPDSIMLMRGVAVVELDEARGHKIPDFNGNSFGYEFTDPGTPVSDGHPLSKFAIPVITAEYQVGLVK